MSAAHNRSSVFAMVETTRTRLGFKKGEALTPTANARNPHMMQEAEAFAPQLRAFEKAARDYSQHVTGFLHSLVPLLESNLPRVWTAVSGGLAEPARPAISHGHPSRLGGDFNSQAILERLELLHRGMEDDVLAPLRRWHAGLAVARERMQSLERLRRDVDKQRATAERKFSRTERKLRRAYLGAGYGSSSSSSDDDEAADTVVPRGRLLEDYQRLALHTERQLQALMLSYEDQERLVWEQLSGLVTDAAWLESYAAATMVKVKEALQAVAVAIGPSKQPLPAFRGAPYGFTGDYGAVGSNTATIQQMSPRAVELAEGATPRGASVLPYQPLKARRGMATPLLVAAAAQPGSEQRHLAAQPVPPVQVGASAIPLEAVPPGLRERAIRHVEEQAAGHGVAVADAPALPSALDTTAVAARSATPAPLTPTLAPTSAAGLSSTTTSPITRGAPAAMPATTIATTPLAPSSASRSAAPVGGSSLSSGATTTTATYGIVQRAAATAGGVVGSVRAAAANTAEAFRDGEVQGEAAGARDVQRTTERVESVAERAEAARERISESAASGLASGSSALVPTAGARAPAAPTAALRSETVAPAAAGVCSSAAAAAPPTTTTSPLSAGAAAAPAAAPVASALPAAAGTTSTTTAGAGHDDLDSFASPLRAPGAAFAAATAAPGLRGEEDEEFVDARSQMSSRRSSYTAGADLLPGGPLAASAEAPGGVEGAAGGFERAPAAAAGGKAPAAALRGQQQEGAMQAVERAVGV